MICLLCQLSGFRQEGNNSVTWLIATCVFSARLHFLRKQTQFPETKHYFFCKSTTTDVVVWGSTGAVISCCRKVWDGQHDISCLMNNLYSTDRRVYIYIYIYIYIFTGGDGEFYNPLILLQEIWSHYEISIELCRLVCIRTNTSDKQTLNT